MSHPSTPDPQAAKPAKAKAGAAAADARTDTTSATSATSATKATNAMPAAGSTGAPVAGPTAALSDREDDLCDLGGLGDLGGLAQARLLAQRAGAQALAAAVPFNPLKPGEIGHAGGHQPQAGPHQAPADDMTTASTVQEDIDSDKLGGGFTRPGHNPNNGPLDRVRVDSGGRALTTNPGVLVADNQNSLKAGLRGPTLLEDFILREKITHFDHERIPERVVHARFGGAWLFRVL